MRSLWKIALFATAVFATLGAAACGGSDVPNTPDAGHADAAVCVPGAECDPFTNCGCDTAAGQKCAEAAGGNHCIAAGTKVVGEACGSDSECAAGSVCVVDNGTLRCLQYCDADHTCPADKACFIRVDDATGMQIGTACGSTCSLLGQDCTGAMEACYSSSTVSTMERGICVPEGTKLEGEMCTNGNDCAKGMTCIDSATPGNPSACRKYCDRTATPSGCDAGRTCNSLFGDTMTGICTP